MFSSLWDENLIKRYSVWHHFPQEGLAWTATWDRLFRKELNFERSKSKKNTKKVRKWTEMGSEKWSGGLERSGKVKIALRIHWEASQRPETLLKIKKKGQQFWKSRKSQIFRIFPIFRCGPYCPYFHCLGSPAAVICPSRNSTNLVQAWDWDGMHNRPHTGCG